MSKRAALKVILMLAMAASSVCGLRLLVFAQATLHANGSCNVRQAQGIKPETASSSTEGASSGIKLLVTGADGKPLQRQRFYLLKKDLQLVGGLDWTNAPRREDFLAGASPQLREWLRRHDCDTLYCPEYEAEYESAVQSVPEFKQAYEEGLRKYKSPQLAMRWITVNFPLKNVRTDYYEKKKAWLARAAQQSGGVSSVMTDEKGIAYFTNVPLAEFYVSNLMPLVQGDVVWNCKVNVPPPIPRQLYSVLLELSVSKPATPETGAK